ncbi:MAG: hypothetical protein U5N26_02675 [Candidatus Marinimicrobia bacterium]|nr:hypothetical protein [Candidatus Neomarinimicrobiota bacterium]
MPVELGINSEDYFEVLSGAGTGDVIVSGDHQALTFDLQTGTAVKKKEEMNGK